MTYFIKLSYNGTLYHGWQKQPNASTIQERLEDALSTILREPISVLGSGRTDAGVHAKNYIAHFETDIPVKCTYIIYKLNSYLPKDIAIQDIFPVHDDAHARFSATYRKYEYWVIENKNPFLDNLAFKPLRKLDYSLMNEAALTLLEHDDFTSFCKLHSDNKTNICHVTEAYWAKEDEKWIFTIKADRFLRNMVRAIVGTLMEVGLGKITLKEFKKIIDAKNRNIAGTSVPGTALYLVEIGYPDWVYIKDNAE